MNEPAKRLNWPCYYVKKRRYICSACGEGFFINIAKKVPFSVDCLICRAVNSAKRDKKL